MSIGMSYEEFWHGDVWAATAYLEAHKIQQKQKNEWCWLQGMYIYDAVQTSMTNAFRKKGARPVKYPESSYPLFGEEKTKEEVAQSEENERLKAELFFRNWARATAKSFKSSE